MAAESRIQPASRVKNLDELEAEAGRFATISKRMSMRLRFSCAGALAVLVFAVAAFAGPYGKFPTTHLTSADTKIMMATMDKALDEGEAGRAYPWQNHSTGASGSITPKDSFSRKGMQCRNAEVTLSAGGQKSVSGWKFCKTPKGWKVLE
jgi:surface antigen